MILPLTYYKVDESLMLKIKGRGDATEDVLCCGWLPHRNDFIKSFCGNSFKCLIEGDGFGGRLGGEAKTDQEAHMDNVILIAWSSKVERDVKQQVVSCCIKKVAKILVQNMHDNILHMFDYLLA